MDNNLPLSIFQSNSNNMQVNNDEIDEEEENADQLRRNRELAENLEKYFEIEDDTVDQFETSVNESQYNCGDQPRYKNELCRLRNELISKDNEMETLRRLLRDEKQEKDTVYNDSQKKIRIFEAEKERAIMTKNQTHDLLVESKTEVSNLQNYTGELQQKIDSLEEINSKLIIELQQTKTMLNDVQHQQHNLELDMRHKNSSRIDTTIKQLQEKHNAQVDIMQQRIDSLSSKLNDKENEMRNLTMRYKDLENSREALLIDKSEVINQFVKKLENQQKQLLSHTYLSDENYELQKKYKVLLNLNEELEKRVSDLTNILEKTMTEKNTFKSTEIQNANREEIKQLKSELIQKNDELQQLKNTENNCLIEANEFKEMQNRLMCRIKYLEDELALHKNKDQPNGVNTITCSKCQENLSELQQYQNELKEKQNEANNCIKENRVLQQKICESNTFIDLLNNELALQRHQNDLINELKLKAEEFEQFMKTSRVNNTVTKINQSSNTPPCTESKIMEEISKRYAAELDSIDKSHKDKISSVEQLNTSLKHELQNLKIHFQVKTDEVESLKSIILKERAKAQEIVAGKDDRARNILDCQTKILNKCRLELQSYQQQMEGLIKELNEKTDLVNQERESIALLQKQIVEIKTSFQRRESDLLKSIEINKQENLNKVTHIKEKYLSAKKTAQHYKVYSEEKEKHMLKEYDRLKEEYKKVEQKLEKKLGLLLSENEEKYNQRLRDIRKEYFEKLNSLKLDKEVSSTSDFV